MAPVVSLLKNNCKHLGGTGFSSLPGWRLLLVISLKPPGCVSSERPKNPGLTPFSCPIAQDSSPLPSCCCTDCGPLPLQPCLCNSADITLPVLRFLLTRRVHPECPLLCQAQSAHTAQLPEGLLFRPGEGVSPLEGAGEHAVRSGSPAPRQGAR